MLQKQVRAPRLRVDDLEEYNDCEYVMAVGRYGDTSGGEEFGFVWIESGWGKHLTSVLDYVETDEFDPRYHRWFVVADSACVEVGSARAVPRSARRETP